MIPWFLMDWKGLFILLNILIYKLQHFFEKNPTLFALRVGTPGANAPMASQVFGKHWIFFTKWRIFDAFLIKGKYSKDIRKWGLRQGPKWLIKSAGGHKVHLTAASYFGCSSIPNQSPSIQTASSFKTTVIGGVFFPAVEKLKSYSHRDPALASFYTASALFLNIRISTHQDAPDRKFWGSKFATDAGIEKKGSYFNNLFY